jgi:putative membrane protein
MSRESPRVRQVEVIREERRSSGHLWLRILLRFVLTILLVWAMAKYLDQYFFVTGGLKAWVVIAALITLMNLFVRPILNVVTLPLRFFATMLAVILVNAVFLWLTVGIVKQMDPTMVLLDIQGGIGGWLVVALVLGFANWLMKMIIK